MQDRELYQQILGLKQLGKRRLLLNDNQRHLLATMAQASGCKALQEFTTVLTPDCSVASTRAEKSRVLWQTARLGLRS